MKNQLNLLNQLQELVLTRDEHRQTGDGSHMDALNNSIDALIDQLEPMYRTLYMRLYKKDHVVMSPMVNGCCAVCGMRLPISQVQQVRMAKRIQVCSSCGRILFNEDEDAPRSKAEKPARGEPRKSGISRFSAEELMISELKSEKTEDAIRELADAMTKNGFVSNPGALVAAAMERESVLSTAMDNNIAFPHVRGVEGGGLTLALGVSEEGLFLRRIGRESPLRLFQCHSRGGERVLPASHGRSQRSVRQGREPGCVDGGHDARRTLEGARQGDALHGQVSVAASHAARRSQMARYGSSAPQMGRTTAKFRAPVALTAANVSALMPPIATAGKGTAEIMRPAKSGPSGASGMSFVGVA